MDATLLTREFTVFGMIFQYWMPLAVVTFLVWIAIMAKVDLG